MLCIYSFQPGKLKASCQLLSLVLNKFDPTLCLHLFLSRQQPTVSQLPWPLVQRAQAWHLLLRSVKCALSPPTPITFFPVSETSCQDRVLRPRVVRPKPGSLHTGNPDCALPLKERMRQTKPLLSWGLVYWDGGGGQKIRLKNTELYSGNYCDEK